MANNKHKAIMNTRPLYKEYTSSRYYEAFEALIESGYDDYDRVDAYKYARSMSAEEYDAFLDWILTLPPLLQSQWASVLADIDYARKPSKPSKSRK